MRNIADTEVFLEVSGLELHYRVGNLMRTRRGASHVGKAVDCVDFTLRRGESVGLLGESGCGKSSIGRLLLKLAEPTGGDIVFDGERLRDLKGDGIRSFRENAQIVFQNPFEALNPRLTVRRSLREPLENAGVPKGEWEERIHDAMDLVRLPDLAQFLDRRPHQLSGGQLQRIVMARALILSPSFVVADEPVSMLDVSVRAGVLNVFREVRDSLGLTALYISHDMALVRYVCERTLVMYLGRIVEDGPTEDIVRDPLHPYTKALVAAVPMPHPNQSHDPLPVKKGAPDARNPPSGCRFRDRCPAAHDRCAREDPRDVRVGTRTVHCHLFD